MFWFVCLVLFIFMQQKSHTLFSALDNFISVLHPQGARQHLFRAPSKQPARWSSGALYKHPGESPKLCRGLHGCVSHERHERQRYGRNMALSLKCSLLSRSGNLFWDEVFRPRFKSLFFFPPVLERFPPVVSLFFADFSLSVFLLKDLLGPWDGGVCLLGEGSLNPKSTPCCSTVEPICCACVCFFNKHARIYRWMHR